MSDKDNGGAAFPVVHPDGMGVQYFGLSVRDYFAVRVMTSLLTSEKPRGWNIGPGGTDNELLASCSYAMADSMLKERAK